MERNKSALSIIAIVIILLITIGLSYAYFSANLTGGEEARTITVTGGTMNIVYNGGANINVANIIPSENPVATKIFTVTGNNTTDIEMNYKLSLVVESNEFSEEALKYKLISTNTNNNGTVVPSINELTNIGTGSKTIELGVGNFDTPTSGNKVHSYNLEVYFPNADYNQNIDQGKELKAYIDIKNHQLIRTEILKEAILSQGGGATAIEAKGNPNFAEISPSNNYQEVTDEYTTSLTSNNNRAIGSEYIFNEKLGTYTLVNYETGKSYNPEYIGYYTCNNNSYNNCNTIYKISTVDGTNTTNSIRYRSQIFSYDYSDVGLYAAEDEYGISYYYRGDKSLLNNNLIFGGFQWKIVRINGDGTIRLIYNGKEEQFNSNGVVNTTGVDVRTKASATTWDKYRDDAKYVGYMYGGAQRIASTARHGTSSIAATYNETSSNAKVQLDAWYQTNILGKEFESKIADNIFCNDRQLQSEVGGEITGPGYGNTGERTNYADYYRLLTKKTPTLKCGLKNDRFTVNDTINGNGALTYPIGLISADEAAMAGIVYLRNNNQNYLYTAHSYWTSSPYYMESSGFAYVYIITNSGTFIYGQVDFATTQQDIRAVINISGEINVIGDGSERNPFKAL